MDDKLFSRQRPEDTPEIRALLRLAIKYYDVGNAQKAGELLKLAAAWRQGERENWERKRRRRPAA